MQSVVILKKLTGKEILWQVFICLPEAQNPIPPILHSVYVYYTVYTDSYSHREGAG